ncbi:MAG: DUF342 domain-containing protein, partial [Candidatus Muiribacteriaceae bacterium]
MADSPQKKTTKKVLDEGLRILQELETHGIESDENIDSSDLEDIKEFIQAEDGFFSIKISEDRLKAFITIIPKVGKGKDVTIDEVKDYISKRQIQYGIDWGVLKKAVTDAANGEEIQEVLFAKGVPSREPVPDTYIRIFEEKYNKEVDQDARIDWRELNKIKSVKKGEKILQFVPGDPGKSGIDITGEEINPEKIENEKLKVGKNVVFNEKDNLFYSTGEGRVKIDSAGNVSVIPEFVVEGHFDLNVGNLDYEGHLIVNGNINEGFKIRVSGDINVKGNIYSSDVFSGGNITVGNGIISKQKMVHADGNIECRFIENSDITSDSDIIVRKAIVTSEVKALGKIICKGERGHIVGSRIIAFKSVECEEAGSGMGTETVLGSGIHYSNLESFEQISADLTRMRNMSSKINDF